MYKYIDMLKYMVHELTSTPMIQPNFLGCFGFLLPVLFQNCQRLPLLTLLGGASSTASISSGMPDSWGGGGGGGGGVTTYTLSITMLADVVIVMCAYIGITETIGA